MSNGERVLVSGEEGSSNAMSRSLTLRSAAAHAEKTAGVDEARTVVLEQRRRAAAQHQGRERNGESSGDESGLCDGRKVRTSTAPILANGT